MEIERIKERLSYCPDTGVFTWVDGRNAGRRAGGENSRGYRHINFGKTWLKEHRIAFVFMTGDWPKGVVDHVNRVTSDNRWSNLRDVTQQENMLNTSFQSEFTGIHRRKDNGRWESKGMDGGKRVHLGRFKSKQEALMARAEFLAEKNIKSKQTI